MKKLKNIFLGFCLFSALFVKSAVYNDNELRKLAEEVEKLIDGCNKNNEERYQIIIELVNNLGIKEGIDTETSIDKQANPKPLTEDEKLISVKDRILKKYKGDLPSAIDDLIFYFSNYEKCRENQISIANRLLMHGNSDARKYHLFKTLAQELQVKSYSFSAAVLEEADINTAYKKIRTVFNNAKNMNEPVFIFIDDIELLNIKNYSKLKMLLEEIEDARENHNLFVFASTNNTLSNIDTAIKNIFAGTMCEIKPLNASERAKLFEEVFANNQCKISEQVAKKLARIGGPIEKVDLFEESVKKTTQLRAFKEQLEQVK
ncbi:MAG: AAA family ATPase [Candidatus Dependentiae bacterium]